jgi:NTE family protein
MLGLVLTAGGARGAYQAGVLKRIAELPAFRDRPCPFPIVTGASAGAINGALLAAESASFHDASRRLAELWQGLRVDQVFRADPMSLAGGALGVARDVLLGGLLGRTVTQGFFDASPLRAHLARELPLGRIQDGIREGHLYAVAITATSYHSGRSFTFVQGRPGHPVWRKSRRVVLPVVLTMDHVCASAAIPIVFPPVRVRTAAGNFYFGDGGLRLVAPFSPAIRLGATHVLAIGIRSRRAAEAVQEEEVAAVEEAGTAGSRLACPPLAQICGVFLNAIFLDHLDTDVDHLQRMNELIVAYRGDADRAVSVSEPMRLVSPLVVSPSEDLALVAQRFVHRMPRVVRYLMDGLGTPDAQSADLMSYLLFDGVYTRTLIDIGYRDAAARIDEIEEFLATRDISGRGAEAGVWRSTPGDRRAAAGEAGAADGHALSEIDGNGATG